MMKNSLPVIAIVGRPNVGKSTLFNRLTKTRNALVANYSGLTRDRQYGYAEWNERTFLLVDTAGLTDEEEGVFSLMAEQSFQALKEADLVLFIVDAVEGLTTQDEILAQKIRKESKTVMLVVNKIDEGHAPTLTAEFHHLGFEHILSISSAHGYGIPKLCDAIDARAPRDQFLSQAESEEQGIKVAIIGRPNVGKSTLVNRLLGEDRVVVFDEPGTTRDSIFIPFERMGERYVLIDTAGIRRRRKMRDTVEKFSVIKTLQAIDAANVVVLVIDAREGVTDQDLTLLGDVLERGRGLIIALNKWDGLDLDQKQWIKQTMDRKLEFVDFALHHFISALHGSGVGDLFKSIKKTYASAMKEMPTPLLTRILQQATQEHQPPLVNGRRVKLRYAHTGGHNPPIIVIHGTQTERLPKSYQRYLINTYRSQLKLVGTPLMLQLKSSENPYQDKKNNLTPRQKHKKERLMRHVKK